MSTTFVDGTTPLDAAHMNALQQKVEKGQANGYASLDATTKVPVAQLPASALYAAPAYGTSLPASPVDGQEAILVDSLTNPSYQWRFRYNAGSSSSYRWEFIGGAPRTVEYAGGGTAYNNAAFATVTPWYWYAGATTWSVPRSGDYYIHAKQTGFNALGTVEDKHLVVAKFTAAPAITPASTADAIERAPAQSFFTTTTMARVLDAVAGTHSVGTAWQAPTPASSQLYDIFVAVIPIRVS